MSDTCVVICLSLWLIVGFVSYVYGMIKFDCEFYGFVHFVFWILLGPIGLFINMKNWKNE
jgi:hypothetical protein